jgi:excisionase family DNA binding protein
MAQGETQRQTLTVDEAAAVLGVSTWAAYEAIKAGDFPVEVVHVGRRVLVPRRLLEAKLGIAG